MITYHIHIKGLVQGVGFRPHVYRIAKRMGVKGWVSNTANGVHILATSDETKLKEFYHEVIHHAPENARIIYHHAALVAPQQFDDFYIQNSDGHQHPDLLITPDFGLCDDCRKELFDVNNRRFHYPFITCTQCGPRYSIIADLPYDREATTMQPYDQCWQCKEEYHDPANRRYFSQTNSCSDCGIPLYLHNSDGECICEEYECILLMVQDALSKGHIIAIKGIGGYLLVCDATNHLAIAALRERKHRPSKPLAVLYPDIETVEKDVALQNVEREALLNVTAPIVLCTLKEQPETGICSNIIAPKLNKIGVLLPYTPLLALIANDFQKPLVATSGNVSGSPILYNDVDALNNLSGIADFFLTYDREIVIPQDDSVIQFSKDHQQKIILRRSRGLAPNYFSPSFTTDATALAMGAELKSSFAVADENHCYISQYLGDQSNYEAQQSFAQTLNHLTNLLKFEPEIILVDKHPAYFVSQAGRELGQKHFLPVYEVQHHKAHFASVLAENKLFESDEPVLGIIWDGTGYGDDQNIWGGEFFVYEESEIKRVNHLDNFQVIAGDKMAKEPRLSALSLLKDYPELQKILKEKFTEQEWRYYQELLLQEMPVQTSSMGRLLDGIASLLDICNQSSYEGEAAMRLEALAMVCTVRPKDGYQINVLGVKVLWQSMLQAIVDDISNDIEKNVIAYKVHLSLARLVKQVAAEHGLRRIAFSGGVMQNALLADLLIDELSSDHKLFFHQQLSPNDECISFGQLAYFYINEKLSVAAENKIELLT
jgi:hydrogenase maturation protein HypF